ncbi:MAG: VWA domain-containing protein, partial [Acidobacteria bacterium]
MRLGRLAATPPHRTPFAQARDRRQHVLRRRSRREPARRGAALARGRGGVSLRQRRRVLRDGQGRTGISGPAARRRIAVHDQDRECGTRRQVSRRIPARGRFGDCARRSPRATRRVDDRRRPVRRRIWLAGYLVSWLSATLLLAQEKPGGQGFSFRSNTDLINVTVTVTDANGRFVPGLTRDDFVVYEDGRPQVVQQFDSDRVPVSLGIALDTSGSMAGEKIQAAQAALNRFLFDLLGKQDQVFLYRFDSQPQLIQGWTSDRAAVSRALGTAQARGGTAL